MGRYTLRKMFGVGMLTMGMVSGSTSPPASQAKTVGPAVAGLFYPAEAGKLSAEVDALLAKAPAFSLTKLRALICPHAGYPYSGPVAAVGYKQLLGRKVDTIIVLGPSHTAAFQGLAIPDAEVYRTPLGDMKIAPKARELGVLKPFIVNPRCQVQRPSWWRETPQGAMPSGQDTPFTWEHSVEVQLPFLQKVQPGVPVIPVLFGNADPKEAAKVLASRMDDRTLLIVSSDLSHFHSYDEAKRRDGECVKAICDMDLARMTRAEACGKQPILTLLHLAKMKGWQTRLLDARNSGDTAGTKDSVVGYATIAFFEPEAKHESTKHAPKLKEAPMYTPEDRDFLLRLARKTLLSVTSGGPLPREDTASVTDQLKEKRACFVTLTKGGELRGCIGHIQPQESLVEAVIHNARAAALEDPRFPPVGSSEAPKLSIEISVLSPLQPLTFSSPEDLLKKLRPRVDGVLIKLGYRQATFLPQVWEELPEKTTFLGHLSMKAGGSADMWKQKGLEVWTYQVEAFKEK